MVILNSGHTWEKRATGKIDDCQKEREGERERVSQRPFRILPTPLSPTGPPRRSSTPLPLLSFCISEQCNSAWGPICWGTIRWEVHTHLEARMVSWQRPESTMISGGTGQKTKSKIAFTDKLHAPNMVLIIEER